jgi:hypothetical protein
METGGAIPRRLTPIRWAAGRTVNWDAIGAIAELVGATGVIASLFYLGTQIRQNTRSVKAASYHAVVTNLSDYSSAIGRDQSTADLLFRGQSDFNALRRTEQFQFALLMISLFRSYEDIFYQYRQEMIDESVWAGWSNSMTRIFWRPGVQIWWPSWREDCHPKFREFLEASTPSNSIQIQNLVHDAEKPTV